MTSTPPGSDNTAGGHPCRVYLQPWMRPRRYKWGVCVPYFALPMHDLHLMQEQGTHFPEQPTGAHGNIPADSPSHPGQEKHGVEEVGDDPREGTSNQARPESLGLCGPGYMLVLG